MTIVIIAIVAIGLGAGIYFLIIKGRQEETEVTSPVVPTPNFTFSFSPGMSGDASSFDFPAQDGVHYVTKASPALTIGQPIKLEFSLTGTGKLFPVEATDIPPASVRLYFQRAGDNMSGAGPYQQYRYWYNQKLDLTDAHDYSLGATLDADKWTDVFGSPGSDHPNEFAAAVANVSVIGFTFGGQYFAGHGVAASGPVHFQLNSFTP